MCRVSQPQPRAPSAAGREARFGTGSHPASPLSFARLPGNTQRAPTVSRQAAPGTDLSPPVTRRRRGSPRPAWLCLTLSVTRNKAGDFGQAAGTRPISSPVTGSAVYRTNHSQLAPDMLSCSRSAPLRSQSLGGTEAHLSPPDSARDYASLATTPQTTSHVVVDSLKTSN